MDNDTTRMGGVLSVHVDRNDEPHGWVQFDIPLDAVRIDVPDDLGGSGSVSMRFDWGDGSVCGLLQGLELAHDRLAEALGGH